MPKRFNRKQVIKVFTPRPDMNGEGGWKIVGNKQTKRYDLTCEDAFHYSHVSRDSCVRIAQKRFDVEMVEVK